MKLSVVSKLFRHSLKSELVPEGFQILKVTGKTAEETHLFGGEKG